MISQIAAMAKNRVIGQAGDLPWDIPADMKYFMQTTRHHSVIMGRKTYDSMGKPLPKRQNIVITRNTEFDPNWKAQSNETSLTVVSSLEQALQHAKETISKWGEEIFVIGGGEIYRQAMPLCDRIYLTEIEVDASGETVFPEFDRDLFDVRDIGGGVDPYPYRWLVYDRKRSN